MEILFLIPPAELNKKKKPVDRVYGCNYGYDYKPAIHLLSLATVSACAGYTVKFLDCPAEGYNARKFIHYLENNKGIKAVVFFTVWLSRDEDMTAAGLISGILPQARIIFSGSYPSYRPEIFLKNNNYIVIRGEPENTLTELMRALPGAEESLARIKGISFLREGRPVDNPSRELAQLDAVAAPERSLLKGGYYFNRLDFYPATVMYTSRGCSHSCTYCAPQALDQAIELEYLRSNLGYKPPLRLKSAVNVIKEFQDIASCGYKAVEICDNHFLSDPERVKNICLGLRKLKLKWICNARADSIKDKNLLRLMKEAGCQLVYIGTESFSQAILDDVRKGSDVEQNYRAVSLLRASGIEPEVSVLMGASGLETEGSIKHSISEAKKMKTRFIHYSVALPLPNTRLHEIARAKGWLKDADFGPVDNVQGAVMDLPFISSGRLKKIVKKCYRSQYLSLNFISGQLLRCNSLSRLRYKLRAFLKYSGYLLGRS